MSNDLDKSALEYHRQAPAGKLAIIATKPLATQYDLSLAYSPGVAAPCLLIKNDPNTAAEVTARGNLVAVITNGTAVLGLGNIGPLASKPVMEGKAVLFKKFAGIDVFDIEVDETDPGMFIETVARLEPTFGGINLEDIKAPECFVIEKALKARMKIPVFHDDQHGTAIVVAAAVTNGLRVVEKKIAEVKMCAVGGGAACLACLDLLVSLGLKKENILVVDLDGVIYDGRDPAPNEYQARYSRQTELRTLNEAVAGADIFLGLSGPRVLTGEAALTMAARPLILALANPTPEILPEEVLAVRDDALIATGWSDYPNQVNNVLCFPFLFRGALDVGATAINEEMKQAAVTAIAELALAEVSDVVGGAYGGETLKFGPEYLIPKPFDPRLILEVAPAVAKAAMESGVAQRPIADFEAYRAKLGEFVYRSGLLMKPVMASAKKDPKRVVFAEGEQARVLQAIQVVVDEGIARPIAIGRPEHVDRQIQELGLRIRPGVDFELVNPGDPSITELAAEYHRIMARKGVSPDEANTYARTRTSVTAALMVKLGRADAMLTGTVGRFNRHLERVEAVIGRREGVKSLATLSGLILSNGTLFMCDTYVNPDPSAETLAEMTILAAEQVTRFGLKPKVGLLSFSNFGSYGDQPSAKKMQRVREILEETMPGLEVEGEMHADAALSEKVRTAIFPQSRLKGAANLLVMPNLDAANIAFNMLKVMGDGIPLGPMLLGTDLPAHVLTPSVTVRGLINMSAIAVVQAQMKA